VHTRRKYSSFVPICADSAVSVIGSGCSLNQARIFSSRFLRSRGGIPSVTSFKPHQKLSGSHCNCPVESVVTLVAGNNATEPAEDYSKGENKNKLPGKRERNPPSVYESNSTCPSLNYPCSSNHFLCCCLNAASTTENGTRLTLVKLIAKHTPQSWSLSAPN